MPRVGEVIDAGIEVYGTAAIDQLAYYKFEFQRLDVADEWHWTGSFEAPISEGLLGVWQTGHLPDGQYAFRLTVVNVQGNYPFPPCEVVVQIRH